MPSPSAAAHTAPGMRCSRTGTGMESAVANTCKHSPEHRPRARWSAPPLAPPAIPQLPPAMCPGHAFTKDPPLFRHPPGPRHSTAQPPSMSIADAGPSMLRPMQPPARPCRHKGNGKGLGAPRRTEPGRGLIPAFPSSWEGEGRVKVSTEQGRGARRQPGYWKPRWAGSEGGR